MSNNDEMSAGELCRNDVERLLADEYPKRLQRRDVIVAAFGWSRDWSDTQIDQALHVLKKRCVIALDEDGYQLRTAPESYNARLVAEANANGERVPEATPVSSMDEKPISELKKPGSVPDNPIPPPAPGKYCKGPKGVDCTNWVLDGDYCESCERELFNPTPKTEPVQTNPNGFTGGDDGAFCKPFPDELDPVAVRKALDDLQERLAVDRVDIDDLALKLEVLDHLGRILDDSIEAVLVRIAKDLQGPEPY